MIVSAGGPPVIASQRDAIEFLEAKRKKGEPVIFNVDGRASASFVPRGVESWVIFRAALRANNDFATAHDMIDALELALRRRHGCDLPLPEEVIQNSDRSLFVAWTGIKAMFRKEGVGWFVGEHEGAPVLGITSDLLNALGHLASLQGQPVIR